jgi:hypothetical protein
MVYQQKSPTREDCGEEYRGLWGVGEVMKLSEELSTFI